MCIGEGCDGVGAVAGGRGCAGGTQGANKRSACMRGKCKRASANTNSYLLCLQKAALHDERDRAKALRKRVCDEMVPNAEMNTLRGKYEESKAALHLLRTTLAAVSTMGVYQVLQLVTMQPATTENIYFESTGRS